MLPLGQSSVLCCAELILCSPDCAGTALCCTMLYADAFLGSEIEGQPMALL